MRLYLDFDGVTHPFQAFQGEAEAERNGHYRACRDGGRIFWHPLFFCHVPALAAALEDLPSVQIYVHSSWRLMWQESRPDDVADFLGPLASRYVRNVPRHIQAKRRYELIRMDMAADKYVGPWLAVDDFENEFAGCPEDNFVCTDSKKALGDPRKIQEVVAKLTALMRGEVSRG